MHLDAMKRSQEMHMLEIAQLTRYVRTYVDTWHNIAEHADHCFQLGGLFRVLSNPICVGLWRLFHDF